MPGITTLIADLKAELVGKLLDALPDYALLQAAGNLLGSLTVPASLPLSSGPALVAPLVHSVCSSIAILGDDVVRQWATQFRLALTKQPAVAIDMLKCGCGDADGPAESVEIVAHVVLRVYPEVRKAYGDDDDAPPPVGSPFVGLGGMRRRIDMRPDDTPPAPSAAAATTAAPTTPRTETTAGAGGDGEDENDEGGAGAGAGAGSSSVAASTSPRGERLPAAMNRLLEPVTQPKKRYLSKEEKVARQMAGRKAAAARRAAAKAASAANAAKRAASKAAAKDDDDKPMGVKSGAPPPPPRRTSPIKRVRRVHKEVAESGDETEADTDGEDASSVVAHQNGGAGGGGGAGAGGGGKGKVIVDDDGGDSDSDDDGDGAEPAAKRAHTDAIDAEEDSDPMYKKLGGFQARKVIAKICDKVDQCNKVEETARGIKLCMVNGDFVTIEPTDHTQSLSLTKWIDARSYGSVYRSVQQLLGPTPQKSKETVLTVYGTSIRIVRSFD
mmetsp:Transcript_3842/g.14284  ORF Transcript_3842/g.14284 Transcript_3842/m.14284 type:complete len:498 (-) Transcript_3842:96-1589(-)|eukprot:CAMPEP_0203818656 /NCGR_PEP_ID=MMETSP0115-20131106/32326_1 /ASSEMBLY_ACC=CAM_ASM_000227 /TAXON_ID=33651 /ORGANISM="Bicosoecid sp, Strain ms1" /LENGTH=497 /DNA_ID=CAMNT_0050727621 /DNA_START=123 /DNA_END=1616 /DNA_ORIENTATION=+